MITITSQRLPNVGLGEAFNLQLPAHAKVLRAGSDPGTGAPTLWYSFYENERNNPLPRTFIAVETNPGTEAHIEPPVEPCGMWWAAGQTYHLFEIVETEQE